MIKVKCIKGYSYFNEDHQIQVTFEKGKFYDLDPAENFETGDFTVFVCTQLDPIIGHRFNLTSEKLGILLFFKDYFVKFENIQQLSNEDALAIGEILGYRKEYAKTRARRWYSYVKGEVKY